MAGCPLNLNSVVAVIGGLSALAATVLVVAGAFRTGRSAQTLVNYRDVASSWKDKAEAQDQTMARMQQQLDEKTSRIASLEAKVATLQDMVSGRVAVEQLTAEFRLFVDDRQRSFEAYTAKVDARIAEMMALAAETRADVRGNAERIARLMPAGKDGPDG